MKQRNTEDFEDVRLVTVKLGAHFGLFVEDEEGIGGLINIPYIKPDKIIDHPLDEFAVGEQLYVVVLAQKKEPNYYKGFAYRFAASHVKWLAQHQHDEPPHEET